MSGQIITIGNVTLYHGDNREILPTLDPYLGSGTTALAATREGFKFIGIEREKKYFDIAVGRVQKQAEELAQQLPLK